MALSFDIPSLLDVCSKFNCSPEVKAMASENLSPSQFIKALQEQKKSVEAVQALSRTMPKEKAVEWAAQSAQIAGETAGITNEEVAALDAARKWAENTCEETKKAALGAAEGLPESSPSYWAANAAGFSDPASQMAEAGEILGAAEDATAHFSSGAVLLSASQVAPVEQIEIAEAASKAIETPADVPELLEEVSQVKEMTPEQIEKTADLLEPFINNGLEIAKSVPGWS
jgi:hypothetical protein